MEFYLLKMKTVTTWLKNFFPKYRSQKSPDNCPETKDARSVHKKRPPSITPILQELRKKKCIYSYWTNDGNIFYMIEEKGQKIKIESVLNPCTKKLA